MAIETVERAEGQTKLIEESREERLTRFFDLEMKIHKMKERKDQLKSQHNAVNNEIKAIEKDKVELLNLINSGQGTFIPVATSTEESEGMDDLDDLPTDKELEEYADAPAGEEPPTEAASVLEQIEEMFADDAPETSDESLPEEGIPAEPAEAEALETETPPELLPQEDEGNPFTEAAGETVPEEGSEVLAEAEESVKTDSWALFDEAGTTGYGHRVGKKPPAKGGIYALPPGLRQGDKRYFLVQEYKLNADANRWEVYCTLLSDAEKKEIDAQDQAEVSA